jgi:hypothetical protein
MSDDTEMKGQSEGAGTPREVLVVISKLKGYIRACSGMHTSDAVIEVLSDHLRRLCDRAVESAKNDGRKTVMDRDFSQAIQG